MVSLTPEHCTSMDIANSRILQHQRFKTCFAKAIGAGSSLAMENEDHLHCIDACATRQSVNNKIKAMSEKVMKSFQLLNRLPTISVRMGSLSRAEHKSPHYSPPSSLALLAALPAVVSKHYRL